MKLREMGSCIVAEPVTDPKKNVDTDADSVSVPEIMDDGNGVTLEEGLIAADSVLDTLLYETSVCEVGIFSPNGRSQINGLWVILSLGYSYPRRWILTSKTKLFLSRVPIGYRIGRQTI